MPVREAVDEDISAMQRIRASVRENTLQDYSILTLEKYLAHLNHLGRGWVYELGGRVVGFAIANRDDASVWALFVEPGCEGRGVGRELHETMLAWLKAQGITTVSLGTDPDTRAARFYEAAGWSFREIDADGEAIYEKEL